MLKKRIIFTLLYDGDGFVLSRNFRHQSVGDLSWLQNNYNFSKITFSIDELIILDVTRGVRNISKFSEVLKSIAKNCFVPISAGGGIRSLEEARILFNSGADKIVINTAMLNNFQIVESLCHEFGSQAIVGSIDLKSEKENSYSIYTDSGGLKQKQSAKDFFSRVNPEFVGEWYLNSMDRDGTGQGYDLAILDQLPQGWRSPIILAGGAGNFKHLYEGLQTEQVNGVATAHLFNFIGDGLMKARKKILEIDNSLIVDWALNIEKIQHTALHS